MTASDQWDDGGLSWRIRRRRGTLGLTREEVAGRARMDPHDLARVEHTPVALTTGALIRLADALDTTVPDLLGSVPEQRAPAAARPLLTDLNEHECRRLIDPGGIGRVAFELAGRLTVVPVNFAVRNGDIVFRTAATTAIGRYGEGPVAFEVDRTDPAMHEGWSVLVSGTARHADRNETTTLRTTVDVAPWADGDRELYVLITPGLITGRRIRAW